jgi:ssDNA-binding Zn-finger/Zn-ribbon topoisomerase 1
MPRADSIQCPDCNVEMTDHQLPMDMVGKLYPAKKCPKCNRVMIAHATGNAMVKDVFQEGDVNQTWVDRVMTRVDVEEGWTTDDPLDSERQLLHYRVREASKYLTNTDTNCPRCGKDNLLVLKKRKSGKDMRCNDCNIQYFYEYPEEP